MELGETHRASGPEPRAPLPEGRQAPVLGHADRMAVPKPNVWPWSCQHLAEEGLQARLCAALAQHLQNAWVSYLMKASLLLLRWLQLQPLSWKQHEHLSVIWI